MVQGEDRLMAAAAALASLPYSGLLVAAATL